MSPGVLYLVSDDAPNGRILQAAGGRFASNMVFANRGVQLGLEATYDDVVRHAEEIFDTQDAAMMTTFWRD